MITYEGLIQALMVFIVLVELIISLTGRKKITAPPKVTVIFTVYS